MSNNSLWLPHNWSMYYRITFQKTLWLSLHAWYIVLKQSKPYLYFFFQFLICQVYQNFRSLSHYAFVVGFHLFLSFPHVIYFIIMGEVSVCAWQAAKEDENILYFLRYTNVITKIEFRTIIANNWVVECVYTCFIMATINYFMIYHLSSSGNHLLF